MYHKNRMLAQMGAGQHTYLRSNSNKKILCSPNMADDNGEKKTCDAPNADFPDEKPRSERASYCWLVNQRRVPRTSAVGSNHYTSLYDAPMTGWLSPPVH